MNVSPLTLSGDSLNEVWSQLLSALYHQPEYESKPRGMLTRECLGVTLLINELRNNILYHPIRNLNYKFQIAEFLWMAYGRNDLATLARYNSQMARFSDDGLTLAGAYGPRLQPQWQFLVDTLSRDHYSRQAVATIWTPNPTGSKDVPCTVALQFIARLGMLNCIVTMRSSDVWLGLPYDAGTFGLLANCLAGVLGLHTGFLQFNLGSSHLYETDFSKAEQVLACSDTYRGITSPALPYFPPRCGLSTPIDLEDVLMSPKKYSKTGFMDHELPYPWSMYADVLNADNWNQAREILAGVND